jgi:hypothetical protein
MLTLKGNRRTTCLALLLFAQPLSVRAADTKSPLLESFLEITDGAFPLKNEKDGTTFDRELRRKAVLIDDARNGYLKMSHAGVEALEAPLEAGLFKRRQGSPLVGIAYEFGDATTGLKFFAKEDKTWRDVTADVMPKISDEQLDKRAQERVPELAKAKRKLSDCASGTYRWVMPRKGTTLVAELASDCVHGKAALFELRFDGGRFTLR